jgi:hypothetical protein
MKKILLTMLALCATTFSAFADAYDYGKISMIDGYGNGDNTTMWVILALIGLSYLFVKWIESK